MPTALATRPAVTRPATARSLPATARDAHVDAPARPRPLVDEGAHLVRSLFGPRPATVEELVARDIEAFTARRLARA